ncbi:hypothetical protein GCM10027592_52950 [Spirosoma flavus]
MKTALFVTDGTVDAALSLRNWLTNNAGHSLHLTIVYSYDIPVGDPLTKSVCGLAKAEALNSLNRWKAILGNNPGSQITYKPFFGSPKQALAMHLLIGSFNYWLTDEQWPPDDVTLRTAFIQGTKQTRPILLSEERDFVLIG